MPRKQKAKPTTEPTRRVTLRDIASKAGVSVNTVSMALQNSHRISTATRARVRKLARSMGYRPDPMLSALAHYRRSRMARPVDSALAWLNFWDEPEKLREHSLYGGIWKGAVAAAEALGYKIEEFVCGGKSPTPPKRLKSILVARGIRGILVPPQWPSPKAEDFEFDWQGFAAVRISRAVLFPAVDVVTHSQAHDILTAFRRIMAKGYRRIGFATGGSAARSDVLFDAGFLKAQRLMPKQDRLPILEFGDPHGFTPEKAAQFGAWMAKCRPDAVISTDPCIKALAKTSGYSVPKDVALAATSVSISDVDSGNLENPEEVGASAVHALAGMLLRGQVGIPPYTREILVRSKWVDGSTLPDRSRR